MKILIVEDDPDMLSSCARLLKRAGHATLIAPSGEAAIREIEDKPDLVLTDLRMPGRPDGLGLLKWITRNKPGLPVVLMTGYGSVKSAVDAMKLGASDYITKPFAKEELLACIGRFSEKQKLESDVSRLRQHIRKSGAVGGLIGKSFLMREVYDKIAAAARVDSPVLILGESGTGKEMVARAIHAQSARAKHPFLAVNCGALPKELIESELFGHKKGSFTSAVSDHDGMFVAAEKGTLFLDEIGEMAPPAQVKLLRALQEKTIRPVGDTKERPVDARILAATNQNIEQAIEAKIIREDLYYRLSVITVQIPALRDRRDDIPILVGHFIERFNTVFGRAVAGLSPEAMDIVQAHPWPGNVRQLENVIEGCFAMGVDQRIDVKDLPATIRVSTAAHAGEVPRLVESEKVLIERALKAATGNKSHAARILGISRTRLYNKIETYKIEE
ncbi:sigma-54-dependent Fis family transcriptional regulator [bacterium]|nr:sigma-54-dependent Fis family transcriptional regulator [bacterium]